MQQYDCSDQRRRSHHDRTKLPVGVRQDSHLQLRAGKKRATRKQELRVVTTTFLKIAAGWKKKVLPALIVPVGCGM